MNRHLINRSFAASFLVIVMNAELPAQTVFFDDFSDGSVTNDVPLGIGGVMDGVPVKWSGNANTGISAESGDLSVSSTTGNTLLARVDDLRMEGDVSVRTQGRLMTDGTVGFTLAGHWALFGSTGNATIGRLGSSEALETVSTEFDPRQEDFLLQFDVVGNTFDFRVWKPGELYPSEPLVQVIDSQRGDNRIGVGGTAADFPSINDYESVFRFVEVASAPIPEPASWSMAMLGLLGIVFRCRR